MSLNVTFSMHFYTSAIEAVGYSGKHMVKNNETVTTRFRNVFTSIFFCKNCILILKCDHHENLIESFQEMYGLPYVP